MSKCLVKQRMNVTMDGRTVDMVMSFSPTWTVSWLKEMCCERFDLHDQRQVDVLLPSGSYASNNGTLCELGISNETVIHIHIHDLEPNTPLRGESLDDLNLPSQQYGFYVYCKTCEYVRPARLRVECYTCGSSNFLVQPSEAQKQSPMGKGRCYKCNPIGVSLEAASVDQCRFTLECTKQSPSEKTHEVIKLWLVTDNFDKLDCVKCKQYRTPVLHYPQCQHFICIECFRTDALMRFHLNKFLPPSRELKRPFTVSCLARNCPSFIPDGHYFRMMGPEMYKEYQQRATELLTQSMGMFKCPNPACRMSHVPSTTERLVICKPELKGCGRKFCKKCRRPYHDGSCSPSLSESSSDTDSICSELEKGFKDQEQYASKEVMKACPQCGCMVTRVRGCSQVKCPNCKLEWCWWCVKKWRMACQMLHMFTWG